MPDLVSISNELKSLPDQALQSELANPTGAVPSYLVLAEAQRRATLRSGAAQNGAQQPSSVYDDVMRGMMARQPAPGPPAPPGVTPPPGGPPPSGLGAMAGSTPPGNFKTPAAPGMAEGGSVDDRDDVDDDEDYVAPSQGSADRSAPRSVDDIIEDNAKQNQLPPNLIRAVIGRESSGDPKAVSPKGATGLMQLMPDTAKRLGVTDRTDPEQNIKGGTMELRRLMDKYNGNLDLALAGYNAGDGAVDQYGGVPPYKETQKYVPRVKSLLAKLNAASAARDADPGSGTDTGTTGTGGAGSADTGSLSLGEKMGPPPAPAASDTSAQPGGDAATALPGWTTSGTGDTVNAGFAPPTPDQPLFDPSKLPINAPPPAPADATTLATPAAATPATRQAYDVNPTVKQELARLHAMAEANAKPNFWQMLADFGFGMAASPAHSLGTQIGAGGLNMTKGEAERQKEAQQLQLGLLGVDVNLDNQARTHQEKIFELNQKAQDQAVKRQDEITKQRQADFESLAGKPGVLRADTSPGMGWQRIANPGGGQPAWLAPNTALVTPEKLKLLTGINDPATGKPYDQSSTIPATLNQELEKRLLAKPPAMLNQDALIATSLGLDPQNLTKEGAAAVLNAKKKLPPVTGDNALIATSLGYDPQNLTADQAKKVLETKGKLPGTDLLAGIDPALVDASGQLEPGQRNDALLASLPAGERAIVKSLTDYDMSMPTSGMALKQPEWQKRLALAKLYDPSFSASNYNNRQKLRASFTSGKQADAIGALNTVTQHLDRLESNWTALDNLGGWKTPLNRPLNWLAQARGDPRFSPFLQDQEAVSNELMRVWRQVGASEKEVEAWKKGLSMDASPESQQSTIREMYQLIGGKLGSLKSQYESGMGRPADFHMLRPDTQKRFAAHGIDYSDLGPGVTGAQPTPGQPAAAPSAAKIASKAHVQEAADKYFGGDYGAAAKSFTNKGWQIQ